MKFSFKKTLWLFSIPLVYSCGQGTPKEADAISKESTSIVKSDTLKQCYQADFEKDTALMHLNIIDSNSVSGHLTINYDNKPKNDGEINGSFKGDTLYVDYVFKTGKNSQEFTNPLVFLKKDGKLIMGVGVIETYMGRSYFAKDKAINFEKGKFTFASTDCK